VTLAPPHLGEFVNSVTKVRDCCTPDRDTRVLQCVAVCCSVLQCVAVCCRVFQCVAVCCNVYLLDIARETAIGVSCATAA